MTPENDVQAYRERRAEDYYNFEGSFEDTNDRIRRAYYAGFSDGRELGRLEAAAEGAHSVYCGDKVMSKRGFKCACCEATPKLAALLEAKP